MLSLLSPLAGFDCVGNVNVKNYELVLFLTYGGGAARVRISVNYALCFFIILFCGMLCVACIVKLPFSHLNNCFPFAHKYLFNGWLNMFAPFRSARLCAGAKLSEAEISYVYVYVCRCVNLYF